MSDDEPVTTTTTQEFQNLWENESGRAWAQVDALRATGRGRKPRWRPHVQRCPKGCVVAEIFATAPRWCVVFPVPAATPAGQPDDHLSQMEAARGFHRAGAGGQALLLFGGHESAAPVAVCRCGRHQLDLQGMLASAVRRVGGPAPGP